MSEFAPIDVRGIFEQESLRPPPLKVRSTPLADPDLNDSQILLLQLAHGMLVDTET
jgi:hypothetical protein